MKEPIECPEPEPAEPDERVEGYVIDVACVRKSPAAEVRERASRHTRECTLMGHCIESGYALVDDAGGVHLLDAEATLQVIRVVAASPRDAGIWLRAERQRREREMRTHRVEEVEPAPAQVSPHDR